MAKDKVTREEIETKIKQIIVNSIGIDEKNITSNSKLRDDLGIDSFAGIELIYGAEDEFGIRISDDEATKLVTVDDIVKIVQEKLKS